MSRELAERRALIAEIRAEERTGMSRELRDRLDAERRARFEEAHTGRYRSVSERRDAVLARAVAELFGPSE